MRKRTHLSWTGFILAVLVTGCGTATPPPTSSAPAPPGGGSAAGALQKLYEAAKQEGEVAVFAPTPLDLLGPVIDGFKQKYPGINVGLTNMTSEQTIERIATESNAGRTTTDVSEAPFGSLKLLIDRNLVATVDWTSITNLPASAVLAEGRSAMYYDNPSIIAYNTNLLRDADVPKQWEDLLKPQWRGGKIVLDSRGSWLSHLGFYWGKERLEEFTRALKAQQPVLVTRLALGVERVASGEVPLGTMPMPQLLAAQDQGAPMKWTGISPVRVSSFVMYVLKDAPHPNAARLYAAWILSNEGRAIFEKAANYALVSPGAGSRMEKVLSGGGAQVWIAKSLEEDLQARQFQAVIQEIFSR